jgi:hypothetical protein
LICGSRLAVISINIIKVILRRGKSAGGESKEHLINRQRRKRSETTARELKPTRRAPRELTIH